MQKSISTTFGVALLLGLTSCSSIRNATTSVTSGAKKLGASAVNLVTKDDDFQYNTARFILNVNGREQVIDIALNPEAAPNHVANFKKLINDGYYDGLAVHRAIPNFLIQTGDPRSKRDQSRPVWGLGGPGYTIPSEIDLKHKTGSVAMARLGDRINPLRESNGSQFYITLKPMPNLDGQYTVFGNVVNGLDVVRSISKTSTDENDVPISTIRIVEAALVPGDTPMSEEVIAPEVSPRPEDRISDQELEREIAASPAAASDLRSEPSNKSLFGKILDRIW